ncbi:L-PSP endoribonuclease family [Colletotrichum tofieldiae]|uniref:L-PSP endoribonuclease family n=1 Tax=Colletotrichum tofieldiae TaxID=708197 RepID=A0A166RLE7_9PEZI|nr:L-PSP endoribonuclease family [Colletotrichum tofieldiae]GKT67283.1 L-PSP endoribonuclease family [Colletotrichum tofieldiae]GKT81567.1 L-PSP endoribonuclease family [Colletotrichum tofieldiae]GKT97542.1 L-PSP endoribonuclease family [Colletotrichum tofieldiae]
MAPNGEAFVMNPSAPEPPTRYAHARLAPAGSYRTIYISGIACVHPATGEWPGAKENGDGTYELDVRLQTAAVLSNIDFIIREATGGKGGVKNLIDSVVYVVDMKRDYQGMNEEWNKVFTTRVEAPARATIGVKELPDPRMLVEIKGVAVIEM